ncbi:MAG: hypothetical protein R6X02_02410 [Enhygromyxa sp.]
MKGWTALALLLGLSPEPGIEAEEAEEAGEAGEAAAGLEGPTQPETTTEPARVESTTTDPKPATTSPEYVLRGVNVVPTIAVAAKTSGKSSLTSSVDLRFPLSHAVPSRPLPKFFVDASVGVLGSVELSDGKSSLSFGPDIPAPDGRLGITFGVFVLDAGASASRDGDYFAAADAALSPVYEDVERACSVVDCATATGKDANWCAKSEQGYDVRSMNPGTDFCEAGFTVWRRADKDILLRYSARYPFLAFRAGATMNPQVHTYREFTVVAGTPTLADATRQARFGYDVGLSMALVPIATREHRSKQAVFFIELAGLFRQAWKPSKDEGRWCEELGTTANAEPVEKCTSVTIGAPNLSRTLWGTLLLGGVSRWGGELRVGAGPVAKASLTGDGYSLGGHLPIFVHIARLVKQKTDYAGMVRIIPELSSIHTGPEKSLFIGLSIALLGDRGLFHGPFEWAP